MVIKEIHCRSILNKSGIPSIDYAINPYIGCGHKCQYCYAVFMKRFTKHKEPWGDFVDVKINAPEILERQLKRLKQNRHISFGTVCDPYQPVEAKYKITHQCIEKLSSFKHSIGILTKSDLILRDIDPLKRLSEIEVGFTISTLNPNVNKIFEPRAPSSQRRLAALRMLSRNNIPTWVFVAPVLPYLSDSENAISQILRASQSAGAQFIMFDTLTAYPKVWNNVMRLIRRHFSEAVDIYHYYYHNQTNYSKHLKAKISKIGRRYKIKYTFAF